MKNNLNSILIAGIFTLLSFTSCQKEGPQGPAGEDGNANVHSRNFSINNWNYEDPSWHLSILDSRITEDIIENGAVLVYINYDGSLSLIPITIYREANYSTTIESSVYVGGVSIFWTDSDLTQPITPPNLDFKIVVIEGSEIQNYPNLDFEDYELIKATFELE